jgi:serine/threonine protein kinase
MPGKAKVAVKEAQGFAKKFWNSAVSKMPGKSKSDGAVDLPATSPPPPALSSAPVQNQSSPARSQPSAPAPSASNQNNNNAAWQRSTTPPPVSNTGELYHDNTAVGARLATQRPAAPPPQAVPPQAAPPQAAPSQPPQQPVVQPPPATNVDPALEYQRLSKEVETDVYKLARMLPDVKTQDLRERLVQSTNKAHQKQPDYAGAIGDLKQIQKDLADQRDSLESEAYDDRCQEFERILRHEARDILGDKAVPLGRAYLNARKEVIDGNETPTRAIPVVEKLTRDLAALTQKRMQAILGVAADYKRLQPALTRAKAAVEANLVPSNIADQAQGVFGKQAEILKRLSPIRQFFLAGSDMYAPPPPTSNAAIEDLINEGFKGGLHSADLDALRKHLAELEKVAMDVIKNMDIQAEVSKQAASLPVDPSQLQIGKELGKGKFGKTVVVQADGAKPMAAKIPHDPVNAEKDLDKEAEMYARLGDHPNIVKCYGKQTLPDGKPALVMEQVEGQEVTKVFTDLALKYNSGEVDRAEYIGSLQHILHGILSGLAQFEALGLAHNDIKGDNIFFDTATGEAKILDMGLSEEHGTIDMKDRKMPMKWTPPEFITQGLVGATTDSFMAGQTAFQQFERNIGNDRKDPWKVEAGPGEGVGDGNFFIAGVGKGRSTEANKPTILEGAPKALDSQGQPTVMPLTKASDKKWREEPGFSARGAAPGNYGVETAYVDFMNKLMHPDPAKRMSPSEALRHPFMTERLLTPNQANQAIQTPRKPPKDAAQAAPQNPPPPQPPPQNAPPPPQAAPQNTGGQQATGGWQRAQPTQPAPQTAPVNTTARQPQTAATANTANTNSTQDNPDYN